MAAQQADAKQERHAAEVPPAMITVEKMNFNYTIRGGDEHIRPVRVFDDGAKTYIQMPPELQHREAPVLLVVGNDGKGEMTNYRVKDQTYIVDRLFDRANLVLGSGKKAQKVEISRGQQTIALITSQPAHGARNAQRNRSASPAGESCTHQPARRDSDRFCNCDFAWGIRLRWIPSRAQKSNRCKGRGPAEKRRARNTSGLGVYAGHSGRHRADDTTSSKRAGTAYTTGDSSVRR